MVSITQRSRSRADMRSGLAMLLLAALLLGGCRLLQDQTPGAVTIHAAQLRDDGRAAMLRLDSDWDLSGPMRDALDHGIALTMAVEVHAGRWPRRLHSRQTVELHYSPLSQRYRLRDPSGSVRSFTTAAYMLDALSVLQLRLPEGFVALPVRTPLRARVHLDRRTLPGSLRLPATFEPAWRLDQARRAWLHGAD